MKLTRDIVHIGRLAAPLALGSISQAVNELADRAFLGNFSESALAAVVPGGMISAVFCAFLSCTIGYSGAVISRRLGAGDRAGGVAALAQGCWLTVFALPLVLLAAPLGEGVLALTGHASELLRSETVYFRYSLGAGAIGILTTVLSGYLAVQKRMTLVCAALSVGSAANILFDWLAIPALGIAGAGLGLLAAGLVACGILVVFVWRDTDLKAAGRRVWRADTPLALDIVREGLPFGFSAIVGAGTFALYILCLGKFSAGLLAAANAVLAIHGIVYFIVCAIESSVLVLVGRAYGRADRNGMLRHARAGMALAVICIFAFYLLLLPVANRALAWFAPDDSSDFNRFAGLFLLTMLPRDVFEALQRVLTGALRAVGKTKSILTAHALSSIGFWLPLFTATTLMRWPLATWFTMTVFCALHAFLLWRRWRQAISGYEKESPHL